MFKNGFKIYELEFSDLTQINKIKFLSTEKGKKQDKRSTSLEIDTYLCFSLSLS